MDTIRPQFLNVMNNIEGMLTEWEGDDSLMLKNAIWSTGLNRAEFDCIVETLTPEKLDPRTWLILGLLIGASNRRFE